MQSTDTVDNIAVDRQRQVPRTGPAQWQDPGDVSCDAKSSHDHSKDNCQRSRRNGNSRKFTDRIVDVPVVLSRQCQPSAQVLDQAPTTGANDAKMQKDPNVSPRASQTPSAKTRFKRKSRERQPTKRCQECLKHETYRLVDQCTDV